MAKYAECYLDVTIANEILMHFRNQRKTSQDVLFSDPIDNDGEGGSLTLQDIMSDEDNIFEQTDLRINAEKMYRLIEKDLTARERLILVLRYGLFCQKPLTQREVAKKLEISRSYVSRLEKKAIGTLRRLFKQDGVISNE